MADQQTQNTRAQTVTKDTGLVDRMLQTVSPDTSKARDIVGEFARRLVDGTIVRGKDTEKMIKAGIAKLDQLISAQLNEVLHAEPFQKLEATWRGLHFLVSQTETGPQLKIKVLNASKKDLLRDLERASEFDQSAIFKKVYEEEFGVLGGSPFGTLVGDYEFSNDGPDIELLERMSQVAAAAHAPFVTAASAALLGLEDFTHLGEPRDISKIFESPEYAKWRSFRESEDSRYVALCLPHVLMRQPYGPTTKPVDAFDYREDVDGKDHSKYLWGNAAYAFATRVTDAFSKYGWCTAIRGVENGGLVEGLPLHTFKTDKGDTVQKTPTEVAVTERRELELAQEGFIPLVHYKGRDSAVFLSASSVNKPKKFNKDDATANARLSAQLQYVFAVSRIAHYLKAIMRDKIGSFMSRAEAETFLQTWIAEYVSQDDDATAEFKARHPLRAAHVTVEEVPGKPGAYRAIALLKPHYQLDEIDVSLRLVADLPQPQGA